ncbi:CDP-glycerol glycerophosphotransferase [Bacilli bacterium PM5-9]|nr:CDP-glycerol glycerophosphotransferase [Bacilli bacterium PM5-9]
MSEIAIIIPTFNSQQTICECLESINKQTYSNNISLYLIDDCSNDDTINLIENFSFNNNIKVFFHKNISNKKQGYSRNKMFNEVIESHVVFLDSDDALHPEFLEKTYSYLNDNNCDIVYVDWVYYNDQKKQYGYRLNDKVLENKFLLGSDCSNILSLNTYFSTTALYSTKFLKDNYIRFGEGYWYEDYEFFVQCAMKSQKIGLLHYPLYIVRNHDNSTTKSNYDTTMHFTSFVKALETSLNHLYERNELSIYYFYSCVLRKTKIYSKRGLKKEKQQFLNDILDQLKRNKNYKVLKSNDDLLNFFFFEQGIENKRIKKYLSLKRKQERKKEIKKLKRNVRKFLRRDIKINQNKIIFIGFDYKLKGNSKYLFEYLKSKNYNVEFIDESKVNTREFNRNLSSAKVIIFESWNRLKYKKKDNQLYIQLWHGSPYKKLFYDSDESYVCKVNNNYRKIKFNDYKNWDYLLCENEVDKEIFKHAFPFASFKPLVFGYPRCKWLLDNKNNDELINKLKEKYNITKPLVLYVPTWRDVQLENNTHDFILNIDRLKKQFNEYDFVQSLHPYLEKTEFEMVVDELLLLADIVISDYSSIVYDALLINKKVILYQKDRDEYLNYRGLYECRDKLFIENDIIVDDENSLIKKLEQINQQKINYVNNTNYNDIYLEFEKFLESEGIVNDNKS